MWSRFSAGLTLWSERFFAAKVERLVLGM